MSPKRMAMCSLVDDNVFRIIPIALGLLIMGLPGVACAEKKIAFVIGNGAYLHASRLPNPANDAKAMSQALEKLGFQVVTGTDQKKADMEEAFRVFISGIEAADIALFFYAGHGFQANGRNYIVPVDALIENETDLEFRAFELQRMLELIEERARVGLVFLDACRTNPFADRLKRNGNRSIDRGLVPMAFEHGEMLIASATSPGRVAADGADGNSPFTTAVLEHLVTPDIDVQTMMRRVVRSVEDRTGHRQTPWQHSSLKSDVYLAGRAPLLSPTTRVPAPAAAATVVTESPNSVIASAPRGGTRPVYRRWWFWTGVAAAVAAVAVGLSVALTPNNATPAMPPLGSQRFSD